jgi:hypothetical protein
MAIDEGVNGLFFLSVLTLICGGFGLAIRYCYRSKCKEFECWGVKIKRDVDVEKEEDMMTVNMMSNKSPSTDGMTQ